ncbi:MULTISPECIES: hypothetical protein [Rhizobium]|uniref:hypothetical protein n=1 Tax=Rhizobium lentis TaxID=1138194 RepID=UPI001FE4C2C6
MPLRKLWSEPTILNAIAEKLKRQSIDDFKGRHFEAWPIVRAVAWYLGLLKASDEFVRSES